jgi:hypothetical protein
MDWLPAFYAWLAVAVSGPVVAFLASYLVDERKAAMLGMAASALMAIKSVIDANSSGEWWIALGAVLGAGTAYWHLFRKGIRQPR